MAAGEFLKMFPQTRGGAMNATPDYEALSASVGFDVDARPAGRSGTVFTVGSRFISPGNPAGLAGLSYSFDFGNARFVLLDQFTRTDGTGATASDVNDTNIADQQEWIASTLAARPKGGHTFVFAHKGLITESHVDSLFGSDPSKHPEAKNAFMASLQAAGAGYFFCGHDHIHQRSVIASPDGRSTVRQVIAASDRLEVLHSEQALKRRGLQQGRRARDFRHAGALQNRLLHRYRRRQPRNGRLLFGGQHGRGISARQQGLSHPGDPVHSTSRKKRPSGMT